MKIDLEALRKVSEGNPNDRVTVNRRWLQAVHGELIKKRDSALGDDVLRGIFGGGR